MCLFANKTIPTITEAPVTCYKILIKKVSNHVFSYYQDFDYGPISEIEGQTFNAEYSNEPTNIIVTAGYIHAYASPVDVLQFLESEMKLGFIFGRDIVICKCEIPAGTEVFYGSDERVQIEEPKKLVSSSFPKQYGCVTCGRRSFAAKKIKFIKAKSFPAKSFLYVGYEINFIYNVEMWLNEVNNGKERN